MVNPALLIATEWQAPLSRYLNGTLYTYVQLHYIASSLSSAASSFTSDAVPTFCDDLSYIAAVLRPLRLKDNLYIFVLVVDHH